MLGRLTDCSMRHGRGLVVLSQVMSVDVDHREEEARRQHEHERAEPKGLVVAVDLTRAIECGIVDVALGDGGHGESAGRRDDNRVLNCSAKGPTELLSRRQYR